MKVVLELQDQPSNVRRVTVRHDIVIGRGSDCNLRLSAPQVSRRHCFLRVGREGVSITDLDSSNGTFVEGKRIKPGSRVTLASGTQLAVGPVRFVVHVREEAVSSDVLQAGSLAALSAGDDSAVNVGDIGATATARNDAARRGKLNLSLEQAGNTADEHEPTEQIDDRMSAPPDVFLPSRRKREDLLDSRAEVIDLGKQIAEYEAERELADADTIRPIPSAADPVDEAPTEASDGMVYEDLEILDVDDDDQLDSPGHVDVIGLNHGADPASADAESDTEWHAADVDVSDADIVDEEIAEIESVEDVEDVLELVDDEIAIVEDERVADDVSVIDAVEVVEEESPSADGGSWFVPDTPSESPDDDNDPDLQKFLKGF